MISVAHLVRTPSVMYLIDMLLRRKKRAWDAFVPVNIVVGLL